MSHFLLLAIVPTRTRNVHATVAKLMEPWSNERSESEGRWGWYVVGGRWTGALTGYDPCKDPRNLESCRYCHATGKRTDALGRANPALMQRCNGCGGTGTAVKFRFVPYEGDVQPVTKIPAGFTPFALLTPDGRWHQVGQMLMFGMVDGRKEDDVWQREVKEILSRHTHCKAVVVDCHQ